MGKIPDLGAIRDWCTEQFAKISELKTVAFSGKYNDLTEKLPLTTSLAVTEEGVSSLDGKVGKVLNDKIAANSDAISQINSNLGWKYVSIDKAFVNIGEELLIDTDNIFNTNFYNDVYLQIGVENISKTNVLINVSIPLTPVGVIFNNNSIMYDGEAYRYGKQIKISIRNISGVHLNSLKVKGILYK